MERHKDAYGTCPRCEYVGWHPYKGKAIIFGDGKNKFKVSLFKCPKCGKKFGFDLSGDIPKPKVSMVDRLLGRKEEEDESDKMLEKLNDDYDKDFRITPDEVNEIIDRLEKIVDEVEHSVSNPDSTSIVLHTISGIGDILEKVTGRG